MIYKYILVLCVGSIIVSCTTGNEAETDVKVSYQKIFDKKLEEVCDCFEKNMNNLEAYKDCNRIIDETRVLIGDDEVLFEKFGDRVADCDTYLQQ